MCLELSFLLQSVSYGFKHFSLSYSCNNLICLVPTRIVFSCKLICSMELKTNINLSKLPQEPPNLWPETLQAWIRNEWLVLCDTLITFLLTAQVSTTSPLWTALSWNCHLVWEGTCWRWKLDIITAERNACHPSIRTFTQEFTAQLKCLSIFIHLPIYVTAATIIIWRNTTL